ncbi:hypothetical protein D1007_61756 [Hordeum vulgare]|nr:hypothetical protein D1007_61756 [Hordeum vulgare]
MWRSKRRWQRRKPGTGRSVKPVRPFGKGSGGALGAGDRLVEEVYADGYFARRVKGARHLIDAWKWADKLQRATDKDLLWASNQMARSFALVRQQEADRYVKRCEAKEADYCLRARKTLCTRELLASGCRNTTPMRDY